MHRGSLLDGLSLAIIEPTNSFTDSLSRGTSSTAGQALQTGRSGRHTCTLGRNTQYTIICESWQNLLLEKLRQSAAEDRAGNTSPSK